MIPELGTPALLLELEVVERNASRMREKARRLGVRLRPHVKTHKVPELARLQLGAGGSQAITVSTLAEARAFADAGFDDILLAVPLAPARVGEAMALGARVRLGVLVDGPVAVQALVDAGASQLGVYLKVDCGYHRSGVDPEAPRSLSLARQLHGALDFRGLVTHAGHSYDVRGERALRRVAAQERDVTVDFAERLRSHGLPVAEVSVGSTPTLSVAESLPGVTEVRPGNYLFHDLSQVHIGACLEEDIAVTVLTTVIGQYADRLVIDAGALALSKDRGAAGQDYGRVQGHPELRVTSLSQEHGVVPTGRAADFPVGTRLRVLPQHSCLLGPLHRAFHALRGEQLVARWEPATGW